MVSNILEFTLVNSYVVVLSANFISGVTCIPGLLGPATDLELE